MEGPSTPYRHSLCLNIVLTFTQKLANQHKQVDTNLAAFLSAQVNNCLLLVFSL